MDNKLYFAYGSNLNLEQMEYRCPDAKVVGPVTLDNYELLFRGCATIAPREGSTVHGLLWEITPQCEQALNVYEGYPSFYDKEPVTVQMQSGEKVTVMAYIMTDRYKDQPALPSPSYYNGIRQGFIQNGLPVEALEKALKHTMDELQPVQTHKNRSHKKKKDKGSER